MYDTLIIGAGLSGLAAGIRLAHYDQRVAILERHTTIGGLNSFYRLDGRNYDVGLHAVTNFTPRGTKRGPLARVLRQLRFSWDDFELVPQIGSRIVFPQATLDFDNDPRTLETEIARTFPGQVDGFRRLVAQLADYDALDLAATASLSARAAMRAFIDDPLLIEMLLCPLFYYGSAREHDMDYGQFCIMFRSVFLEGFARPRAGVRPMLKLLVRRFKELGGELRLRAGVRRIRASDGLAAEVELDDGSRVAARRILSSAGWAETMRLCDDAPSCPPGDAGQLSFCETMSVLNCPPRALGHDRAIVFFNDAPRLDWRKCAGLYDVRSGVICSPNNFQYEEPLDEGLIRVTMIANYDRWAELDEGEYRRQKELGYAASVASAVRFVPDFRAAVVATDMFTPTTIRRFTGHDQGAVYGSPTKHYDGRTHLKNLFICGTDQGFVGIIGAMVSGITMANQHGLAQHP